ncbi:hypothetical protein A9Q84_04380 [Halobacteriovorax marinus]|uniref:Lipoprotein n=1 Tax=Halobacteriovorax marinus TaxID=97084 RepID=A0A1Y5FAE4_9BACT|nr:hypothetical protein A9Q84_04380 [Halobacteriovorax marinus]
MNMMTNKLLTFFCLFSLILFTGCKAEEEELEVPVDAQRPGDSDNVEPTPNPNPPGQGSGKKRVIIGNFKNFNDQSSKKDSKGYSQVGTFEQSSLSGFKNSISRYSVDTSAAATYQTHKLGEAKYCVSVFRVTHPNSESDTLIELFEDEQSVSTQNVNYALDTQAKGWFHLGEFNFEGFKKVEVKISRGTNSNGGVLRADEVRFLKMREGYDCRGKIYKTVKKNAVIDNKYDGAAAKPKRDSVGYREFGEWHKSSLRGFKNSVSRYSRDANAYVTYSAKVTGQSYCLKIFKVTHPNSVSEAKITISQEDHILDEQVLDYSDDVNKLGWFTLGNFQFDRTKPVVVKIERYGDDQGVLRADALRFRSKSCQ